MDNEFNWDRFEELPIVGILRGFEVETVRLLVEAARRGLTNAPFKITAGTPHVGPGPRPGGGATDRSVRRTPDSFGGRESTPLSLDGRGLP